MKRLFKELVSRFVAEALILGEERLVDNAEEPTDESEDGINVGVLPDHLKGQYRIFLAACIEGNNQRREIGKKNSEAEAGSLKYKALERRSAFTYEKTKILWRIFSLSVKEFFIDEHDLRGKKIDIRSGWTVWAVPDRDDEFNY